MKIKLGPFKVDREFWLALQSLPGTSDEQRVIGAIQFQIAARAVKRPPIATKAEIDAAVIESQSVALDAGLSAKLQRAAEEAFITGADVAVELPNFEVGEAVPITPDVLGFDPGPDRGVQGSVVVTSVDREANVITVDGIPSGGHP